jgi:hypothetical protein
MPRLTTPLLVISALFASPLAADEARPRWLTDYEQARQAARDSGKPIFVVFRCEH